MLTQPRTKPEQSVLGLAEAPGSPLHSPSMGPNPAPPKPLEEFTSSADQEHFREAAVKWDECILTMARRFVYSQANTVAWFALIVGNLFCLVWTVVNHLGKKRGHDEGWFILLEIVLNVAMILEIMMRITALGKEFWEEWQNLADVIVMGLCALATSYYLMLHDTVRGQEAEEALIADELLILLRCVVHVMRLCLFCKNHKNVKFCKDTNLNDPDMIQFTAISSDETLEAFGDVDDPSPRNRAFTIVDSEDDEPQL